MSSTLPLRDRLQSNSPDLDAGWVSQSTTPLRIAKRDSPQPQAGSPLARRQSSSYKHLRTNHLVTKSPFRSQIPTSSKAHIAISPSPRRISGEKRPRSTSLLAQAENEHPLGFKRRQSKGFQGLLQKEPVTKSPFKQASVVDVEDIDIPPPLPPKLSSTSVDSSSPGRSSLVSKRLHGPRDAGSSVLGARRQRRKTVTFDERCDVVEFDVEEEIDEDPFESDDGCDHDGEVDYEEAGLIVQPQQAVDESFDSAQPGNDSVAGLVNALLEDAAPVRHTRPDIPHAERYMVAHAPRDSDQSAHSPSHPHNPTYPSTPPRSCGVGISFPDSDVPLGRSTHSERVRAHKHQHAVVDEDVQMFPPSPSPAKRVETPARVFPTQDSLIPKFDFDVAGAEYAEGEHIIDNPFAPSPTTHKVHVQDLSFLSDEPTKEDSLDPANLSIGHSEVSLSGLDMDLDANNASDDVIYRSVSPTSGSHSPSPSPLAHDQDQSTHAHTPSTTDRNDITSRITFPDSGFDSPSNSVSERSLTSSPRTAARPGSPLPECAESPLHQLPKSSSMSSLRINDTQDARIGEEEFEGLRLEFGHGFEVSGIASGSGFAMNNNHRELQLGGVSALDRLMENVANGASSEPEPVERPVSSLGFRVTAPAASSFPAPPPPPKDAIHAREQLIKAKKREVRRREMEQALGGSIPSVGLHAPKRATRRRSMSTGDAEDLLSDVPGAERRRGENLRKNDLLDVGPAQDDDDPLADSIARELKKLEVPNRSNYQVREREGTIYASADADNISHIGDAGDIDGGKAWRTVRRPSDMNEYSKQIKELRAQEKSGKAHGKVFVKVLGLKNVNVPLPQQSTIMTCTLNNGIHFVTTPECRLGKDCRIDQEFELIEHSKLEFTLTVKIRRDPHIVAQLKANHPPPPPSAIVQQALPPAPKGGMRSFFLGSSPKKPQKALVQHAPAPAPAFRLQENLARYLKPDGGLARAFISFKDIASRCDTKLFETSYPLIGQKTQLGATSKTLQVGDIVLQIFRLPPLPGIPPNQLPQSLEECHRGLRHINWHKVTYFEGTLTQNGGDCMSWRRRHLRVIGANLVAYNDVTKRAIATIDLKKAIAVEDDQEPAATILSPASDITVRSRFADEYGGPYGVERSFRLVFPHKQEITFFADTDEDKSKWLEVLRALVGHIPPNPLWAELVWQRQEELAKQVGDRAVQTGPSIPQQQRQDRLR